MTKKVVYILALLALIIYAIVVHNWWVEGNRNWTHNSSQQ